MAVSDDENERVLSAGYTPFLMFHTNITIDLITTEIQSNRCRFRCLLLFLFSTIKIKLTNCNDIITMRIILISELVVYNNNSLLYIIRDITDIGISTKRYQFTKSFLKQQTI